MSDDPQSKSPPAGNPPTLTVVIPNYNHAQFLLTNLEALFAQSRLPEEVIVIDDASTDNSLEVLEAFARDRPLLRIIRNPENKGTEYGCNLGLKEAKSDYVFWSAADDFVKPGFVEKCMRLLAQHPEAGLCCTIGDWRDLIVGLNPHMGARMGTQARYFSPEDLVRLETANRLFISSNSVIWRRDLLHATGGMRRGLRWHSDWFLIHTLAFRHGICFVPEPLAVFFIRPTGYSAPDPAKVEEHVQVLRNILDLLQTDEFADIREKLKRSGGLFVFGYAMNLLIRKEKQYREFLTYRLIMKSLSQAIKMKVRKFLPKWAANLYYRLSGGRAKSPGPEA